MSEAYELTVARKLTGSEPLSYRLLPDGGLCVIAADGRKLWFTPLEAAEAANDTLDQPPQISQKIHPPKRAEGQSPQMSQEIHPPKYPATDFEARVCSEEGDLGGIKRGAGEVAGGSELGQNKKHSHRGRHG